VSRPVPRFLTAGAGVLAACLLFAACSSSTPPQAADTGSTGSTGGHATSTTGAPGTTSTTFNLKYNARQETTTTGCTQVSGGWKLTGTVNNTFANTRNFQIIVDYVKNPGFTVLDTQVAKVNGVAPGKSANWSTTGAAGQSHLLCVIRTSQAYPA
jgi:hypothetical protein